MRRGAGGSCVGGPVLWSHQWLNRRSAWDEGPCDPGLMPDVTLGHGPVDLRVVADHALTQVPGSAIPSYASRWYTMEFDGSALHRHLQGLVDRDGARSHVVMWVENPVHHC